MYQNPNFNKETYWRMRNAGAGPQRTLRLLMRDNRVDPAKKVEVDRRITKKAFMKNSKRARQLQAQFDNVQLEAANA